jgi:hypothetical protein
MKTKAHIILWVLALHSSWVISTHAQGTAFTYQGRLDNNGTPVTGLYDVRFAIYDAVSFGTLIAGPVTNSAVAVSNGIFTVALDFGANPFNGQPRWLDLGVRPNGSGGFTNLVPRQALTPAPYAIFAGTSSNVTSGSVVKSLNNLKDNVTLSPGANVTITPSGNTLTVASTGGSGVWSLNGTNAYYTAGNVGIGTGSPLSSLHISGNPDALRLTGPHPYLTLDDTTGGLYSRIQADGAGMNLKTQGASTGSDPTGVLHLDGVGNVGIGTVTPITRLTVAGAGIFNNPTAAAITIANTTATRSWEWHVLDDGRIQLADFTFAATRLVIDTTGNLGVGVTSPTSKVDISAQDGLRITGFQPFLTLRDSNAGNARGIVQSVSGGLSFLTESYLSSANLNNYAALNNSGNFSVKNITIRGGADVAEPFEFSTENIVPGSVVIIDDEHPGKLKLSSRAYDTRVAGIVSGANGVNPGISLHQDNILNGEQNVALTGRVYVLADATHGAIRPGDLLTTSGTPGHAMKVANHAKAQGAILGKAMSGLSDGKGLVLVLVTLQ